MCNASHLTKEEDFEKGGKGQAKKTDGKSFTAYLINPPYIKKLLKRKEFKKKKNIPSMYRILKIKN